MGLIVEKANIMAITKNHCMLILKKDIEEVFFNLFFFRACIRGLWLLLATDGIK